MMSLDKLFYDLNQSSAFSSVNELSRKSKKSPKVVARWLAKQDTWQRHKAARYNFRKRKTTGVACFTHVQSDLADLTPFAENNGGKRWILIVVDVFSRFLIARPLLRKSGRLVAEALEDCFKSVNMYPTVVYVDRGTEYFCREVYDLMDSMNATLVGATTEPKAAMAERMQRTLKNRMWKYFHYTGKRNWSTHLQKFVDGINNSYNRVIKATPQEVLDGKKEPAEQPEPKKPPHKFREGDNVRLVLKRDVFRKGYKPQFTEAIFSIIKALNTNPPTYHVVDEKGRELYIPFYSEQMIKV